jgi:hypothetical protein
MKDFKLFKRFFNSYIEEPRKLQKESEEDLFLYNKELLESENIKIGDDFSFVNFSLFVRPQDPDKTYCVDKKIAFTSLERYEKLLEEFYNEIVDMGLNFKEIEPELIVGGIEFYQSSLSFEASNMTEAFLDFVQHDLFLNEDFMGMGKDIQDVEDIPFLNLN